jgi:hypothetical protein
MENVKMTMDANVMCFDRACFVAGAAGDWDDEREKGGVLAVEDWELSQMCNSQYTIGSWESGKVLGIATS